MSAPMHSRLQPCVQVKKSCYLCKSAYKVCNREQGEIVLRPAPVTESFSTQSQGKVNYDKISCSLAVDKLEEVFMHMTYVCVWTYVWLLECIFIHDGSRSPGTYGVFNLHNVMT